MRWCEAAPREGTLQGPVYPMAETQFVGSGLGSTRIDLITLYLATASLQPSSPDYGRRGKEKRFTTTPSNSPFAFQAEGGEPEATPQPTRKRSAWFLISEPSMCSMGLLEVGD